MSIVRDIKRLTLVRHLSSSGSTTSDPSVPIPKPIHNLNSAPPGLFPAGVKVWHECVNAEVDICFVHGLSGDRDSTWTHPLQTEPWPKLMLPTRLGNARILTYGYDAYVAGMRDVSGNRLIHHASNLLKDLTDDRASTGASNNPLILVAHSLGGIVCKRALLLSRDDVLPYKRNMFEKVRGIIFLGTPHRGSWMADWARIPVRALGMFKNLNKDILDVLGTQSQILEDLSLNFASMLRKSEQEGRTIKITCFFEELGTANFGKVVSAESATLDGYYTLSIHADHRQMTKFAYEDDAGFTRILGELARWCGILAPMEAVAHDASLIQEYDLNRPVDGKTPLIWASQAGILSVVKLLLDSGGIDVNFRDVQDGRSALSWAAGGGHEKIVEILVKNGEVDLNSRDTSHRRTPLSWAFWAPKNQDAVTRLLLSTNGVDPAPLDIIGRTPLSWNAGGGRLGIVTMLLEAGAPGINLEDHEMGRTPLVWAAFDRHEMILLAILAAGPADLEVRDKQGRSALSWAAQFGLVHGVRAMIESGLEDLNSQDLKENRTPLHWALFCHEFGSNVFVMERIVEILLRTGKVDINVKCNWGRTPLSWACGGGHVEVVRQLLETGKADVNTKDPFEFRTPLGWAAFDRYPNIMKLLIVTKEVDVEAKDIYGRSALSWAAGAGLKQGVEVLLEMGNADINSRDKDGNTPRDWALKGEHYHILSFL